MSIKEEGEDDGKVMKQLRKALKLDPENGDIHLALGQLAKDDNEDEGIKHLKNALKFKPDCRKAYEEMASCYIGKQ